MEDLHLRPCSEDNDSSNILFDIDSSVGMRRVWIDEQKFITDSCHPKALKKDVQTANNFIVALRPYIKGELIVTQATAPPKSTKKSKPKHKKYKKKQQPEEEEPKLEVPEDSNTINAFCTRVNFSDNCIIVYIMVMWVMWVMCLTYYPSDIIHCSWQIYRLDSEYRALHTTM